MVLKIDNTILAFGNLDVGRLLFCLNHPVMRIILNINFKLPEKIL